MANKVVAIIQARMGSTRLPGKMGMNLCGMPVIDWVLNRTKLAQCLDDIVLATSKKREDDFLEDAGNRHGVVVFRGHEKNVLRRFADAGKLTKADIVVRICGDRPLIDPSLVDLAIKHFFDTSGDLSFNHISEGKHNWPRGFGVEVFRQERLTSLDRHVSDASAREHVTYYMWQNRRQFKILPVPCPTHLNLSKPDVRFDLDEIYDLEKLERLCTGLQWQVPAAEIIKVWLDGKGVERNSRICHFRHV